MDIDRLRDGYRPAARRGAILFFVLSEMALVNAMYQYSLIAFLEVFGLSLKKSLPDSILVKRLRNIMDTLTFNIYNYGCTGEHASGLRARLSGVCVSTSLLLRTRGRWDQGPRRQAVYLHSLFKGPFSQHGHIWRPWGSDSTYGFGGTQFSPFQLGKRKVEDCCPYRAQLRSQCLQPRR